MRAYCTCQNVKEVSIDMKILMNAPSIKRTFTAWIVTVSVLILGPILVFTDYEAPYLRSRNEFLIFISFAVFFYFFLLLAFRDIRIQFGKSSED